MRDIRVPRWFEWVEKGLPRLPSKYDPWEQTEVQGAYKLSGGRFLVRWKKDNWGQTTAVWIYDHLDSISNPSAGIQRTAGGDLRILGHEELVYKVLGHNQKLLDVLE